MANKMSIVLPQRLSGVRLSSLLLLLLLAGCSRGQDEGVQEETIATPIAIGHLLDSLPSNDAFAFGSPTGEVYRILGEPTYTVEAGDGVVVLYYVRPFAPGMAGRSMQTNGIAISTKDGLVRNWAPVLESGR